MSSRGGSIPFRRLGRLVFRRRRTVLLVWVVALLVLTPTMGRAKYSPIQEGSFVGIQPESAQAASIISAQFSKSIPNSTLLIVITGGDVSSPGTQQLVRSLVASINSDRSIEGLNGTVDVYSKLYSVIAGLHGGVFSALDRANSTTRLLLGVPALYLGAWEQAFASTHNITASDAIAYQAAAGRLSSTNATAFREYSSHMLDLFNSSWSQSWADPATANLTVVERASAAAQTADNEFLTTYPSESREFGTSVIHFFTLQDFLADTKQQFALRLSTFAVNYVANSTSFSVPLVNSTYSLGRTYDNSSLESLAGAIVWSPGRYHPGPGLSQLVSSLVSPDRHVTLVSVALNFSSDQNLLTVRSLVQATLSASGPASGVQSALVTGDAALNYDFGNSLMSDLDLILPVTLAILIIATGLFFRSALTPFVTLGSIGLALGISQVFIVLIGTFVAKVQFELPTILLAVLLGVGTDYSVFVIARYREERVRGHSVQEAIEDSVTWAGESIATSGATVIISFLALSLASITFLVTMGLIVGLGVLVALAVSLTLVPAVVGIIGGRVFWPMSGERFSHYASLVTSNMGKGKGYFSKSGAFAVMRAKFLLILALVLTVPALYVYQASTPVYSDLAAAPPNLESVKGSNQLTSAFGSGLLFPTYVIITFNEPLVVGRAFNLSEMGTVERATSYLLSSPNVRNVTGPTSPFGAAIPYGSLNATRPADNASFFVAVSDMGKDNRTALLTVNFGLDPYSTKAISDANAIRQHLHSVFGNAPGVSGIYVGGSSGSTLDRKNTFDSEFNTIVPIVAIAIAVVLFLVLGSLLLPLFAVLSVLMTIVWTLAVTKLVFLSDFNIQIVYVVPLFLFVTVLGLGMDYNIFILTRVREEAGKGGALNGAIMKAVEQTGGIITAAAIILAGSLGALMLSGDLLLKQVGFALAFSILLDALLVRTYFMPAIMSLMGRWTWYNPIPYLNRSHDLFETRGRQQVKMSPAGGGTSV